MRELILSARLSSTSTPPCLPLSTQMDGITLLYLCVAWYIFRDGQPIPQDEGQCRKVYSHEPMPTFDFLLSSVRLRCLLSPQLGRAYPLLLRSQALLQARTVCGSAV